MFCVFYSNILHKVPTIQCGCQGEIGCWQTPTYRATTGWTMILTTGIGSSLCSPATIGWVANGSSISLMPLSTSEYLGTAFSNDFLQLRDFVLVSFFTGFTHNQQSPDHRRYLQPSKVQEINMNIKAHDALILDLVRLTIWKVNCSPHALSTALSARVSFPVTSGNAARVCSFAVHTVYDTVKCLSQEWLQPPSTPQLWLQHFRIKAQALKISHRNVYINILLWHSSSHLISQSVK